MNDPECRKGKQLAQKLCAQVEEWGRRIHYADPEWEMRGSRNWLHFGKTFRPYLWRQIIRKGAENENIFFTIEVNNYNLADDPGSPLLIKLDCRYQGRGSFPKKLADELKDMRPKEARWIELPLESWNGPVKEAVDFIHDYADVYDRMCAMLKNADFGKK